MSKSLCAECKKWWDLPDKTDGIPPNTHCHHVKRKRRTKAEIENEKNRHENNEMVSDQESESGGVLPVRVEAPGGDESG